MTRPALSTSKASVSGGKSSRSGDVERAPGDRIFVEAEHDAGIGVGSPFFECGEPRLPAETTGPEFGAIGRRSDAVALRRQKQHGRVVEDRMAMRIRQKLELGCRILVAEIDLRQKSEPFELALQNLEVVAQRKRAVFREQLMLARESLAGVHGRLINEHPPRDADGEHQEHRKEKGEFRLERQRSRCTTRPAGDPNWARRGQNLATALRRRFENAGRSALRFGRARPDSRKRR
jgi:hypothetical protein